MSAAVVVLFFLPWLDRAGVASVRQRGLLARAMLGLLAVSFVGLGVLGLGSGATAWETWCARGLTAAYFAFFLLMPWWSRLDRPRSIGPGGSVAGEERQ